VRLGRAPGLDHPWLLSLLSWLMRSSWQQGWPSISVTVSTEPWVLKTCVRYLRRSAGGAASHDRTWQVVDGRDQDDKSGDVGSQARRLKKAKWKCCNFRGARRRKVIREGVGVWITRHLPTSES
jgi:hypothetical protein